MKSARTLAAFALIVMAMTSVARAEAIADQSLISPFAPKVPWMSQVVEFEASYR